VRGWSPVIHDTGIDPSGTGLTEKRTPSPGDPVLIGEIVPGRRAGIPARFRGSSRTHSTRSITPGAQHPEGSGHEPQHGCRQNYPSQGLGTERAQIVGPGCAEKEQQCPPAENLRKLSHRRTPPAEVEPTCGRFRRRLKTRKSTPEATQAGKGKYQVVIP